MKAFLRISNIFNQYCNIKVLDVFTCLSILIIYYLKETDDKRSRETT